MVRKRPSLLTPPATVDPVNIPLPSSSAASSSEDEKSTKKKKKWFSCSDDEEEEEEEERRQYRITHNLRKRLRDDKEYYKFSQKSINRRDKFVYIIHSHLCHWRVNMSTTPLIICPVCNKTGLKHLQPHLTNAHKLNAEQRKQMLKNAK